MLRKNKDGRPRKTVIKIGGLGCSLPVVIILVAILAISGSLMISSVREALGIGDWPTSFSDLLPDELMGYNDVEITQAILGEVRDKNQLIVRPFSRFQGRYELLQERLPFSGVQSDGNDLDGLHSWPFPDSKFVHTHVRTHNPCQYENRSITST